MKKFLGFLCAIFLGALLGSILSEVLAMAVPALAPWVSKGFTVGLRPPATLDLKVLTLTFGVVLKLTALSFAGLAASCWIYWKLR